jgi:hypothetical protein
MIMDKDGVVGTLLFGYHGFGFSDKSYILLFGAKIGLVDVRVTACGIFLQKHGHDDRSDIGHLTIRPAGRLFLDSRDDCFSRLV